MSFYEISIEVEWMKTLEEVFEERSCYEFSKKKVERGIIYQIYELMKFGPTSANSMPLRIFLVESEESKFQLAKIVDPGNRVAVQSAAFTALFAYDKKFYEKMDLLFPHNDKLKKIFAQNPSLAEETAFRNSSLQAAYFLMVARGFNISCGPMSGFDKEKINKIFLTDTGYEINFICNLGYAKDNVNIFQRLPRLNYDKVVYFI